MSELEVGVIAHFAERIFKEKVPSRTFFSKKSEYPVVKSLSTEELEQARKAVAELVRRNYCSFPRGRKTFFSTNPR